MIPGDRWPVWIAAAVFVAAVVATVSFVVLIRSIPEEVPPVPHKTITAEETGETAGKTAHRFGRGFLKGWRTP